MREINMKEGDIKKKKGRKKKGKKKINVNPKILKVLKFVALLFALYLVLAPFVPEIVFQARKILGIPYKEEVIFLEEEEEEMPDDDEIGRRESRFDDLDLSGNRLVIPSIGVHIGVVEGEDDSVLYRGAWRRPGTGTPATGGNTVITGHRFHYIPPNNRTFYNLNKLATGSKVFVFWNDVEYVYEVYDRFVVEPNQTEIEKNMEGNILTLYTCHPLWTADQRLVVRGRLLEIRE